MLGKGSVVCFIKLCSKDQGSEWSSLLRCLLIPFELIDTLINIPTSNIGLFTIEFTSVCMNLNNGARLGSCCVNYCSYIPNENRSLR